MNSLLRSLTASWPWTTLDVLNHLWQSTAVGLVVLAALVLGRGLSARTRRALGWMALVKFALPTGFLVHAFARVGAAPEHWIDAGALTAPIRLPAFVATATAPVVDAPARVSLGLALTLVWLAGFVGLFAWWLVRSRSLRRRIFAEVQPVSTEMEQRIESAAQRAGLPEVPRCLAVGAERAPGVLGLVAPMVILPRGLEATLAPAELEAVLIHEFVHVQRRDNFWSAVQAFFVSLFWFHPVVWVLNQRLSLETEQSCDERVLEITGDPDTYAGGIVKAVQHALGVAQPGLIGATTPPVITRIKAIFAHGARRDRPLVRGAVLAGGALLIALSGYAGSFAAPSLAPVVGVSVPEVSIAAPVAVALPASVAEPAEPTLSVEFADESIRHILRNVADLFELNVVFPTELKGRTTIKLKDATWRQIFHVTLVPAGYTFIEENKIVKVVPLEPWGMSATPTATSSSGTPAIPAKGNNQAALDYLAAQTARLRREAAEAQQKLDSNEDASAGKSAEEAIALALEAETKAAQLAAIDARRQALEVATKATAESAQMAEQAAKREAEVAQQRALAAEDRAKQQEMIPLAVVNERLKPSNQQMLPSGELVPLAPLATENQPLARALVEEARAESAERRAQVGSVFESNQLDRQPVPTYQARPNYPFALRRAGTAGEATVDFVVNAQGDVVAAYALKFTHAEFGEAATAAVAKWKYKPGRRNGQAVNAHIQVPIVFTLNEH